MKESVKKGLAHGEGIAVGEDTYTGLFKKGYPHGKGTCYYAGGSCYTGGLEKGYEAWQRRIYLSDKWPGYHIRRKNGKTMNMSAQLK
jgi:hypothetical protein